MTARALLSAGASKVYILGRRQSTLDAATSDNPCLISIQCDITSKMALQAAVDHITQDAGYINLLVANSGTFGPAATFAPNQSVSELRKTMFDNTSMQDFNDVFMVNTTATYFSMLAFLELLDAGNKHALTSPSHFGAPIKPGTHVPSIQSQIIVTSSVGAFRRDNLSPPAYTASKAAVTHLVKLTSSGLATHGIRVNALAPGCKFFLPRFRAPRSKGLMRSAGFPSEMTDSILSSRDPSMETLDDAEFIPARRFGSEEEMGGTMVYLASRAGAFCNGMVLVNDGGRLGVTVSTY
jgi:NAD(P)-dependent dehydrogenase (short-subunit alcohol dehydrogenase family)